MSDKVITNPETLKRIKNAMVEISNALTRMDAERDLIKEIVTNTCDNFQLNKKAFAKAAKVYHKQNFNIEVEEHNTFQTYYEIVNDTNA